MIRMQNRIFFIVEMIFLLNDDILLERLIQIVLLIIF